MKNNSQTIQLITSIAFFILSFGVLLFLYQKITDTEQISEQKLIEWRVESARREEIRSLESLMKKIEEEKALIQTHFAQSSNPVPFLDTLEQLARSVNAKNEVSSVDVSGDGKNLTVGMNVTGGFEAFYKFLTLLENSPYNLEFISIDMKRNGETNLSDIDAQSATWSASIQIKLLTFIK